MNENTRAVIQATFKASKLGPIRFGEVIAQLAGVQVESHHVDYRSGRAAHHLPDGATLDFGFDRPIVGRHVSCLGR